MNDEPGRLVDDQEVVVLVDDRERDRLPGDLGGRGLGDEELERLAADGTVVQGGLRPGGSGLEWCDAEVLRLDEVPAPELRATDLLVRVRAAIASTRAPP